MSRRLIVSWALVIFGGILVLGYCFRDRWAMNSYFEYKNTTIEEAFEKAVDANDIAAVRAFLNNGVSPTQKVFGLPALEYCSSNNRYDCCKLLLERGAGKGLAGDYPVIMHPASEGNISLVKLLAQHGVAINARDDKGRSALHVAAAAGNLGMVKELVELGADPRVRTTLGSTPLDLAKDEGCRDYLDQKLKEE